MSKTDEIVAIYNNQLFVIEPNLHFENILCEHDKTLIESYHSLKLSKDKLQAIIQDVDQFSEMIISQKQTENLTKIDTK